MPWQEYNSAQSGAPVLTGQVGSLIALLDACLVNGYGSMTPAGWSKPYSGTNKASYRMGGGRLQGYIDVDDSAVVTAKEARIVTYESMTALATGTNPTPSVGGFLVVRKSNTADATARSWRLTGDERTFNLYTHWDSTGYASGTTFGEFLDWVPSSNYPLVLIGRHLENDASWSASAESYGKLTTADWAATTSGHYLARDATGISKAITFEVVPFFGGMNAACWHGYAPFPNPADGSLLPVIMGIRESGKGLRGVLRGVYGHAHAAGAITYALGDTDGGTGLFTGKTMMVGPGIYGGGSATGPIILEVSDTVAKL